VALTNQDKTGFFNAAESLKLFRRADLSDPEHNSSLIDELYVDPLPHDAVLQSVLRPTTTFVIGRKGTGKSTVFQRLQSELRRSKHQTSAYVDIKTVYESSQVDPGMLERLSIESDALPPSALERLLLYKEFLRAVILEIKTRIEQASRIVSVGAS
jgi:Cdc6-like AAA superfamily ATPase